MLHVGVERVDGAVVGWSGEVGVQSLRGGVMREGGGERREGRAGVGVGVVRV